MKHVLTLEAEGFSQLFEVTVEDRRSKSIAEKPYVALSLGNGFSFKLSSRQADMLGRALRTASNDLDTSPAYD